MKISTILKQGFYSFFAHMMLFFSVMILGFGKIPNLSAGGDLFTCLMIVSMAWGIYCALYEAYGDLDRVSAGWVIPLFICSLFNLKVTRMYVGLIIMCFIDISPVSRVCFKNGIGWTEICMIPLLLGLVTLMRAQWLVTLRTGQTLAKRFIVVYLRAVFQSKRKH